MKFLNSYNYAEYLKRLLMVGQVDPWRRNSEGNLFYALLVPTEHAFTQCLAKCRELGNPEFSKQEFTDYLKLNDVWIINNINEFVKIKANLASPKKGRRRMSEKRRQELQERARTMNAVKQAQADPVAVAA